MKLCTIIILITVVVTVAVVAVILGLIPVYLRKGKLNLMDNKIFGL
jgi:hypothetical protein